jgi:two-component system, OmpR family, phosphate regulon response regulator PhoB
VQARSALLRSEAVRGIALEFTSLTELREALDGTTEQELRLPADEDVRDGDWLLATVCIGEQSTSVAGRVQIHTDGRAWLAFVERDWEQIVGFAQGERRASLPPSLRPQSSRVVVPRGARVLVVDDDAALGELLQCLLGNAGLEVTVKPSAEDAMDWLRRERAELVVLDWNVGGLGGAEFCRRVRLESRLESLPILCLTAQRCEDSEAQAFAAGADDFVCKPFRAPELRARVVSLLHRTHAEAPQAASS